MYDLCFNFKFSRPLYFLTNHDGNSHLCKFKVEIHLDTICRKFEIRSKFWKVQKITDGLKISEFTEGIKTEVTEGVKTSYKKVPEG